MENFPYRNMRHYLEVKGLLNAPQEEIKQAKRAYIKLYQRAYKAQYGKVQLNLVLSKGDLSYLKLKCSRLGIKKPTQYVLELIQKDQEEAGIRPDLLIEIEVALLTIVDRARKAFQNGTLNLSFIERECEIVLNLIGDDY